VAGVVYQPIELVADAEEANRAVLSIFDAADIPVVIIDSDFTKTPRRSGYDVVGIDNVAAGMAVAEHLLSLGLTKIHFQSRPLCSASVGDRRSGVVAALSSAGAAARRFRDFKAEPDDVAALRAHLRRGRPEAFVCGNDTAAVKLKITLERLGYRIPEDIRLVGFDDVKYAKIVTPQLTTVHQPCEKIAEVAFRRLLSRIADSSLQPCTIALPADLVVRASSSVHAAYRRR
jgi:LacI family transcriptional regulator